PPQVRPRGPRVPRDRDRHRHDHNARPGARHHDLTMATEAALTTGVLDTPFALPGGATIKNRLVKAAMSEQLASLTGAPTEALERLYARWAGGGAGMLITGNVMIDQRSLGEPRNVIVEDERDIAALRRCGAAARAQGR